MRSIFLEGVASEQEASEGLAAEFPNQASSTKVVFDPAGEQPVGYLYIQQVSEADDQLGPYLIQADYTGRVDDFDAKQFVFETLTRVQSHIGGVLRDYGD